MHIIRRQLLISDALGQVTSVYLSANGQEVYRQYENVYHSLMQPLSIDIDWLQDHAYIIDGLRIYRCSLVRDDCIVAADVSPHRPTDVKVDPINGYLYIVLTGEKKGLFRIDLADISPTTLPTPQQLISVDLLTLNIDFNNLQLLFPNHSQNTIMSSFLDGTGISNMRSMRVVKPNFLDIVSMVWHDEKFFWTNGTKVFREDYDVGNRTYYHNPLLFFEKHYRGFNLYHSTSQPSPVPYNPPAKVEVLFTASKAIIQWEKPKILQYQGKGAYSKWSYEVYLHPLDNTDNFLQEKTNKLHYEVSNLEPDAQYSVKVRAFSKAGTGPWSEIFIGRTLREDQDTAHLLLAVPDEYNVWQVSQVDLDGRSPVQITSAFPTDPRVTDLAWYQERLFWSTSDGFVFEYNEMGGLSSDLQSPSQLTFALDAACLAFDWLGQKLYWSIRKHGVIRRSDLHGENNEFVFQSLARDIVVDSINSHLYWVTMNSVETSYLNGNDHVEYFSVPYFSGKHVISLALNHDLQKVLWYVKGFENQELYMADLMGNDKNVALNSVRLMGNFQNIAKFSSLQYYSHRLLWLSQTDSVTVGNMECNYTSAITNQSINVTTFVIRHPSLQPYPVGLNSSTIKVIPDAIPVSSVRSIGNWKNFNITWRPSLEVNHGKVLYEVSVHSDQMADTLMITKQPWYEVSTLPPFTHITVSLRAYTYWGLGPMTSISIRSPMSVPTKPRDLRAYVTRRKDAVTSKHTLSADLFWTDPEEINGIISRQNVYYWQNTKPKTESTMPLNPSMKRFILDDLENHTTYYFQVESCTEVGCGPRSDIVSATADVINPVPQLLLAIQSSVKLVEAFNIHNTSLTIALRPVVTLTFLRDENTVFKYWIDVDKNVEEFEGSKDIKLFELDHTGRDVTVDWISRTLYILESNTTTSRILSYRLDQGRHSILLQRNSKFGNIVVDPYNSKLLWSEQQLGSTTSQMMSSNLDGSNIVQLFSTSSHIDRRSIEQLCNCSANMKISSALAMDFSKDVTTEVIFVDPTTVSIQGTDVHGCRCRTILSTTAADRKGLPPDILTVDHVHIYWYNRTEKRLYALSKSTGKITETPLSDVQDMVAYGAHLQPLPNSECLVPKAYSGSLNIAQLTNISVHVQLDQVTWPDTCQDMSKPDTRYTIYYKRMTTTVRDNDCFPSGEGCETKVSYSREVTLDGLNPYTSYTLHAAVSNHQAQYLEKSLSIPITFLTKPGVPSPVGDVTAETLTPENVSISWLMPQDPNGPLETIEYRIKWWTLTDEGVHLEKETDSNVFKDHLKYYKKITDLNPNQLYNFTVLCIQTNGNYISESPIVQSRTFKLPGNVMLESATNTSLNLSWRSPDDDSIMRNNFLYAEAEKEPQWQGYGNIPDMITLNNTLSCILLEHLKPNTVYYVRVNVIYKSKTMYLWPSDNRFAFKTQTGIPGTPEIPVVEVLKNSEFEVTWMEPLDHGEQITHYMLQYRQIDKENWSLAYNGTELRWVVDETVLPRGEWYMFRVAAENRNGWGNFSLNSSSFIYPVLEVPQDESMKIIIAVAFAFVLAFVITVVVLFVYCRRRNEEKRKNNHFIAVARGPDLELATLRELPTTAVQQSNALYAINIVPTDDEIAALPHFRRDQLMLCKFLGSGAFGEVFEGVAKNILSDSSGDTKVAVKTLRKSASDQEKEEFLKEALLMSNFHHSNILSLLGVCLDNDPQFIILELMEGGDLLSFLRSCRPSANNPAELCLTDLVKICVDVSRGCKYLEDMHFVHRDLAARNCLVSCKSPNNMVVKIGDFGLARDIYKNDYYRKEGEGLLPVRWMSPESLVDGVFTTQSDIWAFGVLMWEVVTFGQQPYPARTNIEVLHYVRSGGCLDRPDNCPEELYTLMCKCWNFASEDRPAFFYLLQQLEQFESNCRSISEYLVPIRSTNSPMADVDGYKYLRTTRPRQTLTSSNGPEYQSTQWANYGSIRPHGQIKRATSFDSPEPKDATEEINSHASNYLEPEINGMPVYLELIPDSKADLYMYSSSGERIRDKGDNLVPSDCVATSVKPKRPSYVQTTVCENFNTYAEKYMCKTNGVPDENDSRVVLSNDSSSRLGSISEDNVDMVDCISPNWLAIGSVRDAQTISTHSRGFEDNYTLCGRKIRLGSNTSCLSIDSAQTEPPNICSDCDSRNVLYSTILPHSNYSVANVSHHFPIHSDFTSGYQLWTNNNTSIQYKKNSLNHESKPHLEYMNVGRSKAQVYPENTDILSGYDMVQASLV
ncbi:hypothetical protein CHS0354_025280 [Potamilus streckersoni]|uniref:Tyrosine-protein kinase receptor n=1 Tax=Potamilus streckersoni TaxID=2493646 RepID=A0AAE0VJ25_9BIVA|nr:hypothetical protein CHS0354_025280 [Potamilus streckersoni]